MRVDLGWSTVPRHIKVLLALDKVGEKVPFYSCMGESFGKEGAPKECTEDSGKVFMYTGSGAHPQLIKCCKAHLEFYRRFSWFEEYE